MQIITIYLSVFLRQQPSLIAFFIVREWFLVKGAILPVGCTKLLSRMVSSNDN